MNLSLNSGLDAKALKTQYGVNNRGQIRDIFPLEQAEKTYQCLATETPWGLFYMGEEDGVKIPAKKYKELSPEELQKIYKYIFETARDRYQFMYLFNNLNIPNPNPKLFIHEVFEFLNSEPMLDFVRTIISSARLLSSCKDSSKIHFGCREVI